MRALRLCLARLRDPGPAVPIAVATLVLAVAATRAILLRTGGEAAVPLDDTFIHFQFSRTFAELHPFQYCAGATPVPGATSLLWPLVLTPFHWIGMGGMKLIWVAWALGYLALAGLAYETWRASTGLLSRDGALTAAAMVFAFGGFTWFASSGMEVVPLAWLLMRSARCAADWAERSTSATWRERSELLALALLAPMTRPEGAIGSLIVVSVLVAFPRDVRRWWALLALVGPLVPGMVNFLFTGHWATTTAEAKWLFHTPYQHRVPGTLRYHLDVLFNTLLDGRVWSTVFLPRGIKWLVWPALPALLVAGSTRRRWVRALALFGVGIGMVIPTTYDSFLVNRLRYLWPFAAAWFIGMAALADGVGALLTRWHPDLGRVRMLIGGVYVGALLAHLPQTLDDLSVSADAIRRQQVSLARWVDASLPEDALVGVNDAGAIAYLSRRRTFDLIGLTTLGEARHWAAGPGSRFEHYERLGPGALPSHFVIYERWVALDPLMGEYLTSRTVTGATILGDATKTAYRADYSDLGGGHQPWSSVATGVPLDRLDVADLESESAHRYQLFWATQQDNVLLSFDPGLTDGARSNRTVDEFELELAPAARLVARFAAGRASLTVAVDGEPAGQWQLRDDTDWVELSMPLGRRPAGRRTVRVAASEGETFTSMHYWVFR